MDILKRIYALKDPRHTEGLLWFLENAGKSLNLTWPIKSNSDVYLGTKASGIHKPAPFEYAISIRSSSGKGASELYSDKQPVHEQDGTWTYLYRHEIQKGVLPTKLPRNQALLKNKQDAVPVGVMIQNNHGLYEILGLALVTDYNERTGYFFLQGSKLNIIKMDLGEGKTSEPPDVESDLRNYEKTLVAVREGQGKFRELLLRAYASRCSFTQYDVTEGLEAAHVRPYRGAHTNETRNGLLLRADIHNLFDYGIVGVDPEKLTVILNSRAINSKYAPLHGRRLFLPENPLLSPDPYLLERHLQLHGITRVQG